MLMMMVATTGNEGNKNEIIFLEMENIKMKIRHRTWSSLLGQLGGMLVGWLMVLHTTRERDPWRLVRCAQGLKWSFPTC